MPYVQRNNPRDIVGLFHVRQPGFAEEFLPDSDAGVVAFNNPLPPAPETTPLTAEDIERLLRGLGITPEQITAAKLARGSPLP